MNEDFKNLKEIIELCRLEIDEGNENVNATLDYEDLKELFYLLESYQQEKEKNKKAIEYIGRMEINSIGTPFSYTAPGKELLKILKGE